MEDISILNILVIVAVAVVLFVLMRWLTIRRAKDLAERRRLERGSR